MAKDGFVELGDAEPLTGERGDLLPVHEDAAAAVVNLFPFETASRRCD
ncbi:hypothetical protein [Mesorhizobium sp.]|nr:hypothetical protein [Mesorhizobium sp.]